MQCISYLNKDKNIRIPKVGIRIATQKLPLTHQGLKQFVFVGLSRSKAI
jgi:hypothetical protein